LLVPEEGLAFATLGMTHAVRLDTGEHTLSLGDPQDVSFATQRLGWDPADRTGASVCPIQLHMWRAEPRDTELYRLD